MKGCALASLLFLALPALGHAQDAADPPAEPPSAERAPDSETGGPTPTPDVGESPEVSEPRGGDPTAEGPTPREDAAPRRSAGKVALVVAGDPDEDLRRAARELETALDGRVALPSDPGLRAALRGEPGDPEDGLGRVRRERRGLGFGDDDVPTLARLGRMAGADAVAVLRRVDGAIRVEVLDVGASAFFRDHVALDAAADFTVRATGAAHSRTGAPDVRPETVARAQRAATDEPEDPIPPARAWFKKNWAYIVGGLLLVGVATFFIVRARRDDAPPNPVLRFRTGLE